MVSICFSLSSDQRPESLETLDQFFSLSLVLVPRGAATFCFFQLLAIAKAASSKAADGRKSN